MAKAKAEGIAQHKQVVQTGELAAIVGKSDRWIRQLTSDGVLKQVGRGKYLLGEAVKAYIEHASGGATEDNRPRLNDERAQLTQIKRQMAELDLAVMRGELHRAEDVKAVMNDMLNSIRSRLLALPMAIGPHAVHVHDLAVMTDMLTEEIRLCLTALAEYIPE
ncbi:type IV toxin-antitoxin system AbiEi family antitoxin domain-containing protein [Paenibacillus sp. MBLB4367]|uniref:type IV toxin-antitoxin system AbiEi family antitoxin domain-containing protein n=1 Tax=Paenibacillus sp. MBLB4367 TaxID=3384767 RepID=UPI003907FFDD